MPEALWEVITQRHRSTMADAAGFLVVLIPLAVTLYLFDPMGLSVEPKIDRQELFVLGVVLIALVGWFGLRRIFEQERQIARASRAEAEARFLASHDPLTGLPNRRGLRTALEAAIATPPTAGRIHALVLFDLNKFKQINDLHGHARGDDVLEVVAARMAQALRDQDTLARLGGDEFALVVRDARDGADVVQIGARLVAALDAPILIARDAFDVGAGAGVALIPAHGRSMDELMRKADLALYRAKAGQRSDVRLYDETIEAETSARDELAHELTLAVESGAIVPFYQPIVDLDGGRVHAFEALARWTHPTLGEVAPDRFIPLAEANGLIHALSDQLLRRACEDAMAWPSAVRLCFNISPVQLRDETLGLRLLAIVGETGLAPHRLEVEITEGAVASELEAASRHLEALRGAGLRIVLDDFGAGATTLDHLRRLRFDGIKIDRRFVATMSQEKESATIVKSLLGLAAALGLDVVAEGIEDDMQSASLRKDGCSRGQGFLFSRAVPFHETLALIGAEPASKVA